jgi:hypothetical protein
MKVRFDWQVVNEGEIPTQEAHRDRLARLRKVPRWVWYVALAVLATCTLAGALRVRQRYRETQRRVTFQIQSVIDLEARAFTNAGRAPTAAVGRDLFLAQQDETARRWYVRQKQRVRGDCWRIPPGQAAQWDPCAPVLPAKLNHVDLRGDIAWVEVVEGEPPVRRIRFYRQTGRGWVHTAPQQSFWGKEVTLQADRFVAKYHERDEPYENAYL